MEPQPQQPVQPPSPPVQQPGQSAKIPPDPKMVEALLATTRAQMEQESNRKDELRSMEPKSYLARFFEMFNPAYVSESPRVRKRLVSFLIITVGSIILSLIVSGIP